MGEKGYFTKRDKEREREREREREKFSAVCMFHTHHK
jgi:hypothetical protein